MLSSDEKPIRRYGLCVAMEPLFMEIAARLDATLGDACIGAQ